MSTPDEVDYLPAAGHDRLLPLYDALRRLFGVDVLFPRLVDATGIRPGEDVLDLGTGTGALAIHIAGHSPGAAVVGVDPDPRALGRARRKLGGVGGGSVRFERGYGQDLPFADASFDHVVSAFVLHHLDSEAKEGTFREVARVLRPGGAVHLLDIGGHVVPDDGVAARLALRSTYVRGNLGDAIPERLRAAGLVDAGEVEHVVTRRLGRVSIWRARSRS